MGLLLHFVVGALAPHLATLGNLVTSGLQRRQEYKLAQLKQKGSEVAFDAEQHKSDLELEKLQLRAAKPVGLGAIKTIDADKDLPATDRGFLALFYASADWFTTMVRPLSTFVILGIWGYVALSGDRTWSTEDQQTMVLVLAYWFSDITLRRHESA